MKFRILLCFALLTSSLNVSAASPKSNQIPGVIPSDFDLAKLPKKGKPLVGQSITIDTRNPQTCKEMREVLDPKHTKLFDGLCTPNEQKPYSTVIMIDPSKSSEEVASGVIYKFNDDDMIHANNARNVFVISLFAMGRFLLHGIENVNWEKPKHGLRRAHFDHITKPPVFDKDDFRTNYVDHPYAGAMYYTIARHSGFSAWESFGFSVFSSTFLWEYGLEALFERPSINDLIVTPVIGSLLGELFYQISQKITENDGKVLGSRFIGGIAQMITSPGLFLSALINGTLGADWFKEGDIGWVVRNSAGRPGIVPMTYQDTGPEIALRLRLKF